MKIIFLFNMAAIVFCLVVKGCISFMAAFVEVTWYLRHGRHLVVTWPQCLCCHGGHLISVTRTPYCLLLVMLWSHDHDVMLSWRPFYFRYQDAILLPVFHVLFWSSVSKHGCHDFSGEKIYKDRHYLFTKRIFLM